MDLGLDSDAVEDDDVEFVDDSLEAVLALDEPLSEDDPPDEDSEAAFVPLPDDSLPDDSLCEPEESERLSVR